MSVRSSQILRAGDSQIGRVENYMAKRANINKNRKQLSLSVDRY